MSGTRSTLTSAHHCHGRRRRPSCDHHVVDWYGGQLERRLRDLEQHWVACKIGRDAVPIHRRSRSDIATATAAGADTPSSGACPETPGFTGIPAFRCSPRKLLCSLQQASSGSDASAGAGAHVTVKDGKGRIRRCEEDASSVISVDAGSTLTAAVSMASCSCKCTVPLCSCGCGYSSSSGSNTGTSLFSLRDQEAAVGEVRKREGTMWANGRAGAGWFAAAGVVLGAMAAAILEFGMEDGHVEFLVPT